MVVSKYEVDEAALGGGVGRASRLCEGVVQIEGHLSMKGSEKGRGVGSGEACGA